MQPVSRREFLSTAATLATATGVVTAADLDPGDLHKQLLRLAERQRDQRRSRFAAVGNQQQLEILQHELRGRFAALIGEWPAGDRPPQAKAVERIDGDDYFVEKFAYESMPGYWVSALLYVPKQMKAPAPAIISPCGHSQIGKAASTYQTLHLNLVKRGFVVLTYDPVGQGERSQFWNTSTRSSKYNLTCGEHCVLGNPLYLLGTSLAKYRIWDGMRAIDYLTNRADVDASRIGCVGNSGGGTLTSYIAALDDRVRVPVIGCYITSLPHRMANRIEADPDSDPEQDIFAFVEQGIDHAGLMAMLVPRPTLICAAQRDFFPIEGTRETVEEVRRLYQLADQGERFKKVEADARHGLSQPLREAAYEWFSRWLRAPREAPASEIAVESRTDEELQVAPSGQVNVSFESRHLLPLAFQEFSESRVIPRRKLSELLLTKSTAEFSVTNLSPLVSDQQDLLVLVNGIEASDWRDRGTFLDTVLERGMAVAVVDPRGVGKRRVPLRVNGSDYGDPLAGVEANLAYNAFLTGQSLIGIRVADVRAAIRALTQEVRPRRVFLCGCRDAGLAVTFAAAIDRRIDATAVEESRLTLRTLFAAQGEVINAAQIVPGLLRDFGDLPQVIAQISPRRFLAAGCDSIPASRSVGTTYVRRKFTTEPSYLLQWLVNSNRSR